MENKRKYIIIAFAFILITIVAGTFAWLTYQSKKTALVLTIGDLKNMQISLQPYQINAAIDPELDYTDANYTEVTAINNENEGMNYTLFYDIEEIDNELISSDFKYTIERSTNNGTSYTEYKTDDFSTANTTDNYIILDEDVPANSTYKYRVYVWLDGYTNPNTGIEGATFKGELRAEIIGYARAYITPTIGDAPKGFYRDDTYRTSIISAAFVNHMNVPNDAVITYDLSSKATHPITAWLVNGQESGTYELYIGANETIYAKTLLRLFHNMSGLTSISFDNLNTSETTNMSGMFWHCSSLPAIDVSSFDTSKVTGENNSVMKATQTGMGAMFAGCDSLTSLDLSNFDTSNVKSMAGMFADCDNLETLDISSFITVNVEKYGMYQMFNSLTSLTSLDVSNFNTTGITSMALLFKDCESLTSLDLSNWDTSSVTNMASMFNNCANLRTLDISNFDTSNVETMANMFYNCIYLTSLDLSSFNTSKVKTMQNMFHSCARITALDLSSFDTSIVEDFSGMFVQNNSLTSLDMSDWNTSSAQTMEYMFAYCIKLPSIDISSFNTSSVTNMARMFYDCNKAEHIYVSERWDTSGVTESTNMFGKYNGNMILPNYNASVIDKTNAHYGTGGYLTYKAYTPPSS